MILKTVRAVSRSLLLAILLPAWLLCQWSTSTLTQNALYVCPGFSPSILTFDDGSSIIAGGLTNDIFMGKLDERGYRIWPQPVLAHHDDSTNYPGVTARLIHDGGTGTIFVFPDNRGATQGENGYYNNALYIQRVDGSGTVRWQSGGIQLAPAYTGLKGALPVTDGAGGAIFIVIERDFDHPGAVNIERLWGARYDSSGTLLWRRTYDSSTVYASIQLSDVQRFQSIVFIRTYGGTFAIDVGGERLSTLFQPGTGMVVDRDSILFLTKSTRRDTLNDTVFVYTRITKCTSNLDTLWSNDLQRILDGEYATVIQQPLAPDALGGLFYIQSTYDDNNFVRTRVYHVDSSGNSRWPFNQVYYPNLRTRAAFPDGSGGIVLLLGNTYDRAARHDYTGTSLWPSAPITTISDPENIGMTGEAEGDNRGGAIVPFWSFSGGVKVQHTGRNGIVGVITDVREDGNHEVPFTLDQNYPNPFNPNTNITFHTMNYGLVTLKVYDLLGRDLVTLVNEVRQPGQYSIRWNAQGFASGVYYYRLETPSGGSLVRKMILVR